MGFGYSAQALVKDVSYRTGCLSGRANIATVKAKIVERKQAAVDPEVEAAAEELGLYFEQLNEALGPEAFAIAVKQEFDGEIISDEDSAILKKAEARKVKTKIDKAAATRLAKLIAEKTRSWR